MDSNSLKGRCERLKYTKQEGELLEEEEKEDRISSLPDSILLHILCFLPSTKCAIKTSLLSKRWQYLWTLVPNLIFHQRRRFSSRSSKEFFKLKEIDNTLTQYSSPKLQKLKIELDSPSHDYISSRFLESRLDCWLHFAVGRKVEELVVDLGYERDDPPDDGYDLPLFLYENNHLRYLDTSFCEFVPEKGVSWSSLRVLNISCANLNDEVIGNILDGSPMLKSLKFLYCQGINRLHIPLNSSLESLAIGDIFDNFEDGDVELEISAPSVCNLELLSDWGIRKCKLLNLSNLVTVSLELYIYTDTNETLPPAIDEQCRNMVKHLIEKVKHAKQIKLGSWFIQVLSALRLKELSSPLSICKCLTVDIFDFCDASLGIATLLHSSIKLEKLVLEFSQSRLTSSYFTGMDSSNLCSEDFWTSMNGSFNCLLLHLKTIEVYGLLRNFYSRPLAISFLKFVLENARVLEKIVILDSRLKPRSGNTSTSSDAHVLSSILSSFPRASSRAVVVVS